MGSVVVKYSVTGQLSTVGGVCHFNTQCHGAGQKNNWLRQFGGAIKIRKNQPYQDMDVN